MDRSSALAPTVPEGLAGICSPASGSAVLLASVDDSGCPDVAGVPVTSPPTVALLELPGWTSLLPAGCAGPEGIVCPGCIICCPICETSLMALSS